MASCYNISSENKSKYNQSNLSEALSDIPGFIKLYRDRINQRLKYDEDSGKAQFVSFARKKLSISDQEWLYDNTERFIKDTPNQQLIEAYYLRECGFILSMAYSANGEKLVLGFSSGLIQVMYETRWSQKMSSSDVIISKYAENLKEYYINEKHSKLWYPMFYRANFKQMTNLDWISSDHDKYLKNTPNGFLYSKWFFSEAGAITSLLYSPNGNHIIAGHSSGMIEMRNGITGGVLCTLRNIQFPPKPVYALQYSPTEENVCYAACMDGAVYRIELPYIDASATDLPGVSIRADPLLESLTTQFYGSPGISAYATPFFTQRTAALSLGILCDQSKMVVGYADTSVKLYDMETQEVETTYKIHKLRLQFIPKKLQRMHFGQVVALRSHPEKPHLFASGAWDKTLRIWDVRCQVGCVMTFEGVDICSDSIDLIREQCITGSWQTTEALSVWDLTAKKRLNIIRVQNRRPDIDGEYIYACRYWRSKDYNRKGKYGIIGGSGTNCVEVINLHNRYITCSYPAAGTVLAIASHQDRIAFGGTHPALCIVTFHDPKHEKALYDSLREPEFVYKKPDLTFLDDDKFSSQTPLTSIVIDTESQFSVSTSPSTPKSLIENKLKSTHTQTKLN